MPDALTVSMLFLALFVWIEGGRAHWRLIVQSDAAVNPQEHAYCEMQAGLARDYWLSHVFHALFILFWPAWIAAGFVLAATQRAR